MLRKIYKGFRNSLSPKNQSLLSQIVFQFSGKPFVQKDQISSNEKFPGKEKGGMIISADFELGWAWRYAKNYSNPHEVALKMAKQARKNFPVLLELFDKYNIPITWATVGHLFLEKCNAGDHDWMKRIPYFVNRNWRYETGDWYDCDPYTNWDSASEWYAPDLIRLIQQSKTTHEIGTHTFTHIDFSDKNCPKEVAENEIKACIDVAKPYDIKLESIVFPGGTYGNTETLKNAGIKIYRKNVDVDIAYPYYDNLGLLVSPTSAGFGKSHDWTSEYYIKRFKRYIDKAIKTGTIAHFWFHPSLDKWTLNNVMPDVLEYAVNKRKQGDLWIGTMKEISNHINSK